VELDAETTQDRAEAQAVCGGGKGAPLVIASGADAGREAPSTVLEVLGEARVLREGAISKQRLRKILDASGIDRAPGELL
jgi:tRNA A37 threonylcarbamoyladenosine synthetase subunit TsaC/SUA5/YrdC